MECDSWRRPFLLRCPTQPPNSDPADPVANRHQTMPLVHTALDKPTSKSNAERMQRTKFRKHHAESAPEVAVVDREAREHSGERGGLEARADGGERVGRDGAGGLSG